MAIRFWASTDLIHLSAGGGLVGLGHRLLAAESLAGSWSASASNRPR